MIGEKDKVRCQECGGINSGHSPMCTFELKRLDIAKRDMIKHRAIFITFEIYLYADAGCAVTTGTIDLGRCSNEHALTQVEKLKLSYSNSSAVVTFTVIELNE